MTTTTNPSPYEIQLRRRELRAHVYKFGPAHFDMSYWMSVDSPEQRARLNCPPSANLGVIAGAGSGALEHCGTTACLAGHGAAITGLTGSAQIAEHFGLPIDDEWGSCNLFHIDDWEEVALSGGLSLYGVFEGIYEELLVVEGEGPDEENIERKAQWVAVLVYLDDLIATGGPQ